MRILSITAGAAGMYCGSCFRDNALASELISRGHDVLLLPLYTPTRTDEANVSRNRVFFGGVSVYLQQNWGVFRRTLGFIDRLLDSSWLLGLAAGRSVGTDPRLLGRLTVSMLRGEEGHQRKEFLKLVEWLRRQSLPDVVNLPNSLLISLARPISTTLRRPVCCTLQGEELFIEGLPENYRREALRLIRSKVEDVELFLAVSEYCAEFMSDYLQIPPAKIRVVPLGINLQGHDPAPRERSDVFRIGYFARVAPEKGLHVLAEAYRLMRSDGRIPAARLDAAGYLGAEHRSYLKEIEGRMKDWGLEGEFRYHGILNREEKIRFLSGRDVVSVPATYDEPKGLFLLEAMASGTPVLQPRRGAFTEIVEKTGGGVLVKPDDPEALAEALADLCKFPEKRDDLAQRGTEGVRRHYSLERMADRALEVYSELVERRGLEETAESGSVRG